MVLSRTPEICLFMVFPSARGKPQPVHGERLRTRYTIKIGLFQGFPVCPAKCYNGTNAETGRRASLLSSCLKHADTAREFFSKRKHFVQRLSRAAFFGFISAQSIFSFLCSIFLDSLVFLYFVKDTFKFQVNIRKCCTDKL